jgi:hypothetical protein
MCVAAVGVDRVVEGQATPVTAEGGLFPLASVLRSNNPNIPLVGIRVAEQQPEYSPRWNPCRGATARIFPSMEGWQAKPDGVVKRGGSPKD